MTAISATNSHLPKVHGGAKRDFALAAFGLIALVAAELVLIVTIPGTNYLGGDGKAAQATILAALEFARPFDVSNLDPLQGIGSQMAPMNVWVNPAYWPFAFFDKGLAAAISGVVALIFYAIACYLMARCYDVPRLPSIVAAQLCVILFGPAVLALEFASVFATIPGLAIVYAPHLVAFGLLARVSPARLPQLFPLAGGLLMLLFLSLYCDPLWTLVSGVAWVVPFAVVTLSPLRGDMILTRCALLGGCVAVLYLSGALEYVYTLSQYTARVQFAEVLQRARLPDHASIVFTSWAARYFYGACIMGWVFGLWLQRGRARTLALAGAVSGLASLTYSAAYLLVDGTWSPPRPILIEHALFPLFVAAAMSGYWGAFEVLAARASHGIQAMRTALISQTAVATAIMAVASIIPIMVVVYAATFPKSRTQVWYEPWPNEPELRQFLDDRTGLGVNRKFRGSSFFWTATYEEFLTLSNLWIDQIPSANGYGQLVTPQSIYFIHNLLRKDLTYELNWFRPMVGIGATFQEMFRILRALGVRYFIGYDRFAPEQLKNLDYLRSKQLRSVILPQRAPGQPPGLWLILEFADVNVGDYSPIEVTTAVSAAEILSRLGAENFDFTREVVLSTPVAEPLVTARGMEMAIIRGGLHVSGHSDGTSLIVLPQQFSNCLRAYDHDVRLLRANLIMTGMIFSGDVNTDISFDYGIFSPGCRLADLADMERLGMKLAAPSRPSSINLADRLRAIASAIK